MPIAHACSFPVKFCNGLTKSCNKCAFYFLNYNNDYAHLYSYYTALFTWNLPFIFLPLIYDHDRHIQLKFANLTESFPFLSSFQKCSGGDSSIPDTPFRKYSISLSGHLNFPQKNKRTLAQPCTQLLIASPIPKDKGISQCYTLNKEIIC